jgi:hypothetical protein
MILTLIAQSLQPAPMPSEAIAWPSSESDWKQTPFMAAVAAERGFGTQSLIEVDDGNAIRWTYRGFVGHFKVFTIASCFFPMGVVAGILAWKWFTRGEFDAGLLFIGLISIPIACDFISFLRTMCERQGGGMPCCSLDRSGRSVEFFTPPTTLTWDAVDCWVLVEGWQKRKSEKGSSSTWAMELSCIARDPTGEPRRYHVCTTGTRFLLQTAELLSQMTRKPLHHARSSIEIVENAPADSKPTRR